MKGNVSLERSVADLLLRVDGVLEGLSPPLDVESALEEVGLGHLDDGVVDPLGLAVAARQVGNGDLADNSALVEVALELVRSVLARVVGPQTLELLAGHALDASRKRQKAGKVSLFLATPLLSFSALLYSYWWSQWVKA
jgi:hypothetical protein